MSRQNLNNSLDELLQDLAQDCQDSKPQVCTLAQRIEEDMKTKPKELLDNPLTTHVNRIVCEKQDTPLLEINDENEEFERYLLEEERLESLEERKQWVLEKTKAKIERHLKANNSNQCTICNYMGENAKAFKRHLKQHFVKYFCKCGFNSCSREYVSKHNKENCPNFSVYEIDEATYQEWAAHVKVDNLPPFGACNPDLRNTLNGIQKRDSTSIKKASADHSNNNNNNVKHATDGKNNKETTNKLGQQQDNNYNRSRNDRLKAKAAYIHSRDSHHYASSGSNHDRSLTHRDHYYHERHHPYHKSSSSPSSTKQHKNHQHGIKISIRRLECNLDDIKEQIKQSEMLTDSLKRIARNQECELKELYRQLERN